MMYKLPNEEVCECDVGEQKKGRKERKSGGKEALNKDHNNFLMLNSYDFLHPFYK